jgi:hypothetical protein
MVGAQRVRGLVIKERRTTLLLAKGARKEIRVR